MTGFHYRFAQHGNVLKRGLRDQYGPDDRIGLNYGVGLHFRATPRFAVEAGYAKARMDLEVRDQKFLDGNNIDKPTFSSVYRGTTVYDAQYDIAKLYDVATLQVYYFSSPEYKIQNYVTAGISKSFLDSKQTFATASYNYNPTGEHTTLTAYFSPKYVSGFVEAGFCSGYGPRVGRVSFFAGVNLHIAGPMVFGEYSNTGGPQNYSDHASASGTYFSISLRLGYTIGYLKAKEKETSIHDRYHQSRSTKEPKTEKVKRPKQKQRGPAFKGFRNKKSNPARIQRGIQPTNN